MKKYVVFTSNNARIFTNPNPDLEARILEHLDPGVDFVINPDLRAVRRHPPHIWALKDDKITIKDPMDHPAIAADIMKYGAENNIFINKRKSRMRRYQYTARKHKTKIILSATLTAVITLVYMFMTH